MDLTRACRVDGAQPAPLVDRDGDERPDRLIGFAERYPASDKRLGQVRRLGEAFLERRPPAVSVEPETRQRQRYNARAPSRQRPCLEEGQPVLLLVAVV